MNTDAMGTMSASILPMTRGKLKLVAINFYPTPSRSDGLMIRLGAMTELVLPTLRGLGLIARKMLTPFERDRIGELGRRILSSPFDMLDAEFDLAWHTAPAGEALAFLRNKHHHSLRVEGETEIVLPARLFQDGKPVRASVRTFMNEMLDEAGEELAPLHEDPITGPEKDPFSENMRVEPLAA